MNDEEIIPWQVWAEAAFQKVRLRGLIAKYKETPTDQLCDEINATRKAERKARRTLAKLDALNR